MNEATRAALSTILFYDEATPLDELIKRCLNEPVHLSATQAEALGGTSGLTFWDEPDGCALLAADLHSLARDAGLPENGLVLRLPASVDDKPLVRIAAEAFRSWLSYGIRLRALVLPEGMRETSDASLAPLCFEHLALPSTFERYGKRTVQWSKLTAYPERITFSVADENPHLNAADGSLYADSGATLIAAAYPYGEEVRIADGVHRIRDDAFMHTPQPPKRIVCPSSLASAPDPIDDNLLWIRENGGDFAAFLDREKRLGVSFAYRIIDGNVYDFNDEGALLAATDGEADAAAPPEHIDEAPLVRIGRAALPARMRTVTLPQTVRIVEDSNRCEHAERIVLDDGLEAIGAGCFMRFVGTAPVRIPRGVRSIGERSFAASRVYFDALDTTVFVPSGIRGLFNPTRYVAMGAGRIATADASCIDAFEVPFDMNAYDALLASDRRFYDKTQAIVDRLGGAVELKDETAAALSAQLTANADAACELVAVAHARRAVERLAQAGFYDDEQRFLAQCELLRKARKTEALGYLMDWHAARSAPVAAKPSARFSF